VGAYGESIRHSPGLGDIYHLLRNKSGREGGREKKEITHSPKSSSIWFLSVWQNDFWDNHPLLDCGPGSAHPSAQPPPEDRGQQSFLLLKKHVTGWNRHLCADPECKQ